MKAEFLLLALLLTVESLISEAGELRVCPAISTSSACKILENYSLQKEKYFVTNTSVVFFPGIHRLAGVLAIADVSNMMFSSVSGADLHCDKQGGLFFSRSKNITIKNINLISCGAWNSQLGSSAALAFERVAHITIEKVNVINSTGYGVYGTQVCDQVTIRWSVFRDSNNIQEHFGGNARFLFHNCSVYTNNTLLVQSSEFLNGSANERTHDAGGLTVDGLCHGMTIHLDNITVSNNLGGNIRLNMSGFIAHDWEILVLNSRIVGGNGVKGAGLYFTSTLHPPNNCDNTSTVNHGNSMEIVNTNFTGNTATAYGGGVMVRLYDSNCKSTNITLLNCTFDGNVVTDLNGHGAAFKLQKYSVPRFHKCIIPMHQIHVTNGTFCNNAIHGGTQDSVIELENIEMASLKDCTFSDNKGTAIAMTASDVIFTGKIHFHNNMATNGGALRFCDSSAMFINHDTTVIFQNNYAQQVGGAIFAEESCLDELRACFFQPLAKDNTPVANLSSAYHVELTFTNNTAGVAGDAIYGGNIDACYTYTAFRNSRGSTSYNHSSEVFNETFKGLDDQGGNDISSEPYRVTFCDASAELERDVPVFVIPGRFLNISVVTVGQRSGTAPSAIVAEFAKGYSDNIITHQIPTRICTNLSLVFKAMHVESTSTFEFTLKVQRSNPQSQKNNKFKKSLTVFIQPCPWGFKLNRDTHYCECAAPTNYYCDLDTLTINLGGELKEWIGCDKTEPETLLNAHGCSSHRGNCNMNRTITSIPAECGDELCADNRTGILCGSCMPGQSIVLGTGRCKSCPLSNVYLSLVVVYLGAGILLIVVLTKFKLTINNGSLNGLLFYANFVHWNQNIFFPQFQNADILRLIIAWMNLDLGIEVCFFSGMTALHAIWLQIGYILYVFLQVSIILLCRRYVIFTRFFGRNVTKAMSTLMVLLFAKIMSTVASALTPTDIRNKTEHRRTFRVLSADGNIRYGSRQHIPLLVVASFLFFFLALFMFCLLFNHILTKVSSRRCFKWVARFQPFFETITGPCNHNYTFWPGYLLFIRVLYLILKPLLSRSFYQFNTYMYMTSGFATVTIIFSFLGPKGVYKKWSLNILELSLIGNFVITCLLVGRGFEIKAISAVVITGRVSVCIAFITFLAYHTRGYNHFKKLKRCIVAFASYILAKAKCSGIREQEIPAVVTRTDVTVSTSVPAEQTPLLHAQIMAPVVKYDKLREPLMEDNS